MPVTQGELCFAHHGHSWALANKTTHGQSRQATGRWGLLSRRGLLSSERSGLLTNCQRLPSR